MGDEIESGASRRRMAAGTVFLCVLAAVAWSIERSRRVAAEDEAQRTAVETVRGTADRARVSGEAAELRAALTKTRSRALAAEAGRSPDPQRAILLARAAVEADASPAALAALRAALLGCLERATLRGGEGAVRAIAWSPDGTRAVAAWEDGTIVVAAQDSAVRGAVIRAKPFADAVEDVSFSPDGHRLLCALDDGTARLLDADAPDLREVVAFRGHTAPIYAATFSPDGSLVATASADMTARLWTPDGTEKAVLRGHEGGVSGAFFAPPPAERPDRSSRARDRVLTISRDGTARLWATSDGRELAVLRGHTDAVLCAAWTRWGLGIVTGSRDRTARMWDLTGASRSVLRGPEDAVVAVAESPSADHIAIAGKDGTVAVFDADGMPKSVFRAHLTAATSISFTPGCDRLLTSSWDATARLWTLDGREVARFRGHPGWVDRAALSPDGRHVLTAARDGTARFWDVEASEVAVLDGPGATALIGEWTEARRAVSAARDGTATVQTAAGAEPAILRVADARIVAVAASADGKTIATGDTGGVLRLWDGAGKEIRAFPPRTGAVCAVAFDPKRGHVLSAADDGRVLVHDPADGRLVDAIEATMSRVTALAVSPDGTRVVTAAAGEAPRLWALGAEALLAAAKPRILRDWTPEEREAFADLLPPEPASAPPAAPPAAK